MMLSLSTYTRRRSWRMSLVVMVLGPIGLTRPAPLSLDRRRMLGSLAGWPIAQPSWLASQWPGPLTFGPGGRTQADSSRADAGSNRDRRKADMQRSCAGKMGGTIAPGARKASAPRSLPARRSHCIVGGMTGIAPAGRPGHSGAGAGFGMTADSFR